MKTVVLSCLHNVYAESTKSVHCVHPWVLVGKWADPNGTAMLGQPVNESEQAPELIPLSKISLISKGTHGPRIRY